MTGAVRTCNELGLCVPSIHRLVVHYRSNKIFRWTVFMYLYVVNNERWRRKDFSIRTGNPNFLAT